MKSPNPTPKERDTALPLAKLLKVFQLIALLKAGRWTAKQLGDRFDISKSSLYRYLELMEEVGFCVEKDFHKRYFILSTDDDPLQAQFTLEEMNVLRTMMKADAEHPLTASILKKISLQSEADNMPRLFLKAHLGNLVEQLTNAMRTRHQVILKNYHSANSNKVSDRLIEPIHFGDNYTTIVALDVDAAACKQFKLDRISEVKETHTLFAYEHLHQNQPSDIFGMAGVAADNVTLELSLRAWLLMREEFPLSRSFLKQENDRYLFHGPVVNYSGIGRFVLGLIDEITIIDSPDFRSYVLGKMKLR